MNDGSRGKCSFDHARHRAYLEGQGPRPSATERNRFSFSLPSSRSPIEFMNRLTSGTYPPDTVQISCHR